MVLTLATGGIVFVTNLFATGHVMPADPEVTPVYDGFENLWQFPVLAFLRPLSLAPDDIWVPWLHAHRHWARHDLFFSDWGLPASLCLLALPFGVARYARSAARPPLGEATTAERVLASLSFVIAFLLFLPLRMEKIGVLATSGLCRYTFFLPVVIALWTAVPAMAELRTRSGGARSLAVGVLFGAAALFAHDAFEEAKLDLYEPLDYVLDIARRPEDRRARRSGQNFRAGVVVDRAAGPSDTIAFDGGFDGWSYYCFGATLQRHVTYLHPERGLPVEIPDDAKWVVVDRLVTIDFGHPTFVATGDWSYLGQGKPSAEDVAVFTQMQRDPRFRLVYSYEAKNQAVFARIPPS